MIKKLKPFFQRKGKLFDGKFDCGATKGYLGSPKSKSLLGKHDILLVYICIYVFI